MATITLRNELLTLRQFLSYCARIGVVEEGLPDVVDLPKVKKSEQTNDTFLGQEHARRLLKAFRNGDIDFERGHAFLEIAWYTGARMGAIRGLRADVVSERVNASVDVLETHYDKASPIDEFEQRRERHLNKLRFDEDD